MYITVTKRWNTNIQLLRRKAFIVRFRYTVTMINTIANTLTKNKHIIMLTIAAAALVAYMLPFDNLMGVADAQYKKPVKKDSFKKDFKKSIQIGASQSAVLNSGILTTGGGGGSYSDSLQADNTAFNFLQQSQQICSGISNCPSTQAVQFTPYTFFGGP
jgi:hypothetical protein